MTRERQTSFEKRFQLRGVCGWWKTVRRAYFVIEIDSALLQIFSEFDSALLKQRKSKGMKRKGAAGVEAAVQQRVMILETTTTIVKGGGN